MGFGDGVTDPLHQSHWKAPGTEGLLVGLKNGQVKDIEGATSN